MAKKQLNDVAKRIKENFGNVLISGEELKNMQGGIINTTLSLDIALSGGIAEGTSTLISGAAKIGKTSLCLHIIAQAQKQFKKKCYYFDVEGRIRTELLSSIDGLVYTQAQEDETGVPKLSIIKSSEDKFLIAEDILNIVIDILTSETNVLVILDSIAALCTQESYSQQIGDSKKMAAIPTFMYEFFRKVNQILPSRKSNFIAITHLQASPRAYSGPVAVGGNALQYFASNILRCTSAEEIEKDGEKIGKNSEFKVYASALGPPSKVATIYVRYGKGCDQIEDLIDNCERYGFINRAGAWYEINGEKVQGKNEVKNYLLEHTDLIPKFESDIRGLLLPKT